MRRLARLGLWMLGITFPVFLAACYGPPHRYSRMGNVMGNSGNSGNSAREGVPVRTGGERTEGGEAAARGGRAPGRGS